MALLANKGTAQPSGINPESLAWPGILSAVRMAMPVQGGQYEKAGQAIQKCTALPQKAIKIKGQELEENKGHQARKICQLVKLAGLQKDQAKRNNKI